MDPKPYKIPHPFRKLTKELIDILVKDIALGSTQRLAAEANGITEPIFYIWLQQGRIDIAHQLEDTLPAYFVKSLAKVRAEEVQACRLSVKNSDKGHKGAEWTLEHAYWRDFSTNAANVDFNERLEKLEEKKADGETP